MRANRTNFSKKIFKISLLLLVITTFSCGEYNIADKDIFQKKITVFEYFEPFYEVLTTKTGFITKFTRSVTNGDSTNCEIVQSKDQRISKIGFDGKIIWEKNFKFNQNKYRSLKVALFLFLILLAFLLIELERVGWKLYNIAYAKYIFEEILLCVFLFLTFFFLYTKVFYRKIKRPSVLP